MDSILGCTLLIDDDQSTNFINKMLITRANCSHKIVTQNTGLHAIEFIKSNIEADCDKPILIMLDLNMPIMNGWEFLEEYEQLGLFHQKDIRLIVLTTSINPDDIERAKNTNLVHSFINKPLTAQKLDTILHNTFPEYYS
ncbi:MAG: response regulator [Flavipsychrobacter sp.]